MRSRHRRAAGFIVTIELLLILTILVIGTFAGCAMLRNELIQLRVNKEFSGVILRDSSDDGGGFDDAFGKPVSYDLCEAPEILCKDFGFSTGVTTAGATEGLYALVGVRATHFVSRNRVYFDGTTCGDGNAYVAVPVVSDPTELPIGYFNCGLQVDDDGRTSAPWLWAGGDMVRGPDVVHAVSDGHRTARSIHDYLLALGQKESAS